MRSFLAILLAVVLVCSLAGCGAKTIKAITVENGAYYSVTPQEFVDEWNEAVKSFKTKTKDENAVSILLLPDFEESAKLIKLGESLDVTYITDELTGKLQQLEISWYYPTASKEEIITASFMASSLPTFINPETEVDLNNEFNMDSSSDFEVGNIDDNGTTFSYVSVQKSCILTISPTKQ